MSLLGNMDLHLFNEGTHLRLYEALGSHVLPDGGVFFAVWAPNAERVSVIGEWNDWRPGENPLEPMGSSRIWTGTGAAARNGDVYKYRMESRVAARAQRNPAQGPMSIYEVHLGSWRRVPEEEHRPLSYRELAPQLAAYVRDLGFTHVEFLPVMEHPFYGSWGYQSTGYFAPTRRYGDPEDFKFLVDTLHQAGIGVVLDWVPSHFPTDEHGLAYFDGTHLFEHADPRQGFHPDWKSAIFNYGRKEVQSFLLSSAMFWLREYHIDALRVDAVASMLYLDYSREDGEWIPNPHGGRENLDAIALLRRLNEAVYGEFPDAVTIAEESTAWPMVSRPTYVGGLGFGMKWDMGWMHDTLVYFSKDPVHRRFHHDQLTFRMIYAFNENVVLPLSHDEVVHGKGSLISRMPGDHWQQMANLRLLLGYQYAQPGKKLLFMGSEFAQWDEWDHERSLDWHLAGFAPHAGVRHWVRDLNHMLREMPELHTLDFEPGGFEWVDAGDTAASVVSFLRRSAEGTVLVVANFTPVPRSFYGIGVPQGGYWRELLNSDAEVYGGSGLGNTGGVWAQDQPEHGRPHRLSLMLPPLGILFLAPDRSA